MEALRAHSVVGISLLPERDVCPCSRSSVVTDLCIVRDYSSRLLTRRLSLATGSKKSSKIFLSGHKVREDSPRSRISCQAGSGVSVSENGDPYRSVQDRVGEIKAERERQGSDPAHITFSASDTEMTTTAKFKKMRNSDRAILPPRMCTLRAFGQGEGVMTGLEGSVYELLAASIEASAQLRSFEILSGRLAMMAFFVAIGVETVTGSSVFKGIDVKELGQIAALSALAAVSAAGFALAWRAKAHVASTLSTGCLNLVDTAVDTVIDGLFYDEDSLT